MVKKRILDLLWGYYVNPDKFDIDFITESGYFKQNVLVVII